MSISSTSSNPETTATAAAAAVQDDDSSGAADAFFRTDHLKNDLKGRALRGGALTLASQIIKQVVFIGSTAVLARLLSPADNGLVAMVVVFTSFIDLFNDMGLSTATVQWNKLTQAQASALFWLNAALGIAFAILTIALSPAIAWFYNEPRLTWITIAIASSFALGGFANQHRALLTRQMRFRAITIIGITSTVVSALVGVIFAWAGFGYWALVAMTLAAEPIDLLGPWIACRWIPNRPAYPRDVRSMLSFGGNLTGYRLMIYLARNIDNLLIGRVFGAVSLGLYSRAYSLLLLPVQRINAPIVSVALPALGRLNDSPERYRRAYMNIAAKVCLATMPLVGYMLCTSDWIVALLLGPKWSAVSVMFSWLGLAGLVESFTSTVVWLFTTQKRAREQFHWGIIGTTCIVLAIVTGMYWGPVGVAAMYGITGLCVRTPLVIWFAGRSGPVSTRDIYSVAAPYACVACVEMAAIYAFRQFVTIANPFIGLCVTGVLAAIVSLLMLSVLPAGRQALVELKGLSLMLVRRKKTA